MHIENEVKYDFSDVLIKPKRSYYTSRKEVDLERKFKFKWSNLLWKGIPVVASNMDTVGTIDSAKILSKHNTLTCLQYQEKYCYYNRHRRRFGDTARVGR